MNISRFLSVLTVAVATLLCSCQSPQSSFVRVEDGRFVSEDYPSHFLGTNFWYGAILASEGEGGDLERLEKELDDLKALGLTNLRVLVGGDGPDGIPTRIEPTLQKAPGVYNDTIFLGLDRLLAEMAERGMKAVLYLNNSWEWSGGYGMYLEWAGEGKSKIPAVDGYPAFQEHVSQFVTSEKAKALFADHVRHVVSRTNTVTGKPYTEDPTIFSWQIGNEPRCFRKDSLGQAAFADWLWETASLIKSLDSNHMVSVGSEGKWGCEGSLELYEKIHSCPDIDYLNIHIWPYNWHWVREHNLKENLPVAIANTDEYIDEHLVIAERLGKPVVLEEFGFPRDDFKFAQGTTTNSRNDYYKHVFMRVVESAKKGGLLAGANYWGWGGHATQSETSIYWQKGDDYCGDPAQEQQGLNSVYISDNWTNLVTLEAYRKLQQALYPQVEFEILEEGGIFKEPGRNTLNFNVWNVTDLAATFEFKVETDLGNPVMTHVRKLKLNARESAPVSFDADLAPGFYKVTVSMTPKGGEKTEIVSRNIGCKPEWIASPQDSQHDFNEFWQDVLDELKAVKPEYRLTLIKEKSNDIRRTYKVEMKSLGGESISGIYVEPVAPGTYPAMIHYMGYNTQPWDIDPSGNPGMSEFILCVRNQALNMKEGEQADWVTRGLESQHTYYYRGAVADAVRAIDFVWSREKTDHARVFAQGESQGGALTIAAASLDDRFTAVAPSAPFLCDFPDYLKLAHWPANELKKKAEELGMSDEELYKVLSYFDMKNMADRITCPIIMGVGLQDDVCPIHTNFAGYNMVTTEKSWICYPYAVHNVWEQPGWPKAKEEFFRKFL